MIKDIEKEVEGIIKWIKKYVEESHSNGVVVGNSGGKDSATVIGLAIKALGNEKVIAVSMPCQSIPTDLEDAKLVADTFDVKMMEVDLTNAFSELENEVTKKLNKDSISKEISREGKINIKPRLRMTTLYSIAQTLGYLVIGTGNACESFVGYTTKWGDSASDFNPIGNYTVEEVLQIGRYVGVPTEIIEKAPNDGLGGQTDEQKMGVTYREIMEYMENGKTNESAMKIIERMHRNSEHKRNLVPTYKRK